MAWTAVARDTRLEGTQFLSFVSANDGTTVYDKGFYHSGTTEALRRAVRSWIDSVETRSAVFSQIPPGYVIDCRPVTLAVVPGPTAAEVARTAFASSWQSFCAARNAVAASMMTTTDPIYVSSRSAVLSRWTVGYLDMLVTV